ncbi:MAG TPA: alpha/beta hydrolase [Dehalococcoidia bacterium]|nr:alpha/beta hydrolase [Dehalococcoidia bacterium]
MPTIRNGDATIYYEEYGPAGGFPLLTFAPGGMGSTIAFWRHRAAPVDPTAVFADEFRVIALDQRNAGGQSHAPIRETDGWHSYTSDHIALLDHLGIDQCHLYGQCIGGPFILGLLKAQPQRVISAVLAQPIGRVGPLQPGRSANYDAWAKELKDHPEATEAVLDAFYANLYGSGFAYSVDRDFVRSCQTPCLVLAGNDEAHPFAIAEEIASLLPHAEFIPEWKSGDPLAAATARMKQFLSDHTPVRA